ncbi:MAG: formylglycine-generating enzyme family protein, partial [Syntrophales bacterium]
VRQWCLDWYGDYSSDSVTDPTGPSSGSYRVNRGGSWNYSANLCRSAYRNNIRPDYMDYGLGFRLVRTP